jgi:hypothetical protein
MFVSRLLPVMMMLGNFAISAGAAIHAVGHQGRDCQWRVQKHDRQEADPSRYRSNMLAACHTSEIRGYTNISHFDACNPRRVIRLP